MNRKKLYSLIGLVILIIFLIVAKLIFFPGKPVIGFYGVPEKVQNEIISLANKTIAEKKPQFIIRLLDNSLLLQSQLLKGPQINLLFILEGKASENCAPLALPPAKDARKSMLNAVQKAGMTGTDAYATPILLDYFEIAYNTAAFAGYGLSAPRTLTELTNAAKSLKKPSYWPFICAGSEDSNLLSLIGALTEAYDGADSWAALVKDIEEGKNFKDTLSKGTLKKTLDTLIAWRKDGLIHPEWYRMKTSDVHSFMENEYTGIVFMSLSAHRTIPLRVIEHWESIPFPSSGTGAPRTPTAPVLLGILLGKQANPASSAFLASLTTSAIQKKLASSTGLAPVNSSAETPDKQASDARLWVAAARKPVPDIGMAAFEEKKLQSGFANAIREYLISEGTGY